MLRASGVKSVLSLVYIRTGCDGVYVLNKGGDENNKGEQRMVGVIDLPCSVFS
jgi:hypothetical protein